MTMRDDMQLREFRDTEDCIDVTILWLKQRRDEVDAAIAGVEMVRALRPPSAVTPADGDVS